jgi:hypothetical protein
LRRSPEFCGGQPGDGQDVENSRRLAAVLMEVGPKYFPEDKLKFFATAAAADPPFIIAVRPSAVTGSGRPAALHGERC